ncbi:hypothetical protein BKA69DRAFT_1127371 [Paraphysoderma sedebokerense]|nr:hypothetical protein BKA69DRAFT_1127371 [Paraphysoderma sedebokerense]
MIAYFLFTLSCILVQPIFSASVPKHGNSTGINEVQLSTYEMPQNLQLHHLDILDGKSDGKYLYPAAAGEGADIYLLDTGIFVNNTFFEGRTKVLLKTRLQLISKAMEPQLLVLPPW